MALNKIDDRTVYYIIKKKDNEYSILNDKIYDGETFINDPSSYTRLQYELLFACKKDYAEDYTKNEDYNLIISVTADLQVLNNLFVFSLDEVRSSYYFVGLQFRDTAEKDKCLSNYDKIKPYLITWFQRLNKLNEDADNCFSIKAILKRPGFYYIKNDGLTELSRHLLRGEEFNQSTFDILLDITEEAMHQAIDNTVILAQ